MEIIINSKGVITKKNKEAFTDEENDQLLDAFIKLVEGKEYVLGGGFSPFTEKELEQLNN